MKKEINTEIIINASAEKVWDILTAFDKYPEWNPFIRSLTGETEIGKKIRVVLTPPESKGMTFTPRVLVFKPYKEFRWLGHLFIPGIFDGEHIFEISENGDSVIFRHSEKFSGLLVPVFKKMLEDNTLRGFDQMNHKLKELAEKN